MLRDENLTRDKKKHILLVKEIDVNIRNFFNKEDVPHGKYYREHLGIMVSPNIYWVSY